MITDMDIDSWFSYHAPNEDQIVKYREIRQSAKMLAKIILDNSPVSADQTVAIRKLRECVMVANAAIACEGK